MESSGATTTSTALAARLRAETRDLHTQAERSGAMRTLLRGELERTSYCRMLRNFHAIYAALETALAAHARDPVLAPVDDRRLARTQAIAADLRFLHGEDWATSLPLLDATTTYVDHLQHAIGAQPARLLAHAYVRYLGDLSGGQVLLGIVATSMRLHGDDGTRFYRFDAVDARDLAQQIRRGLDAIDLADAAIDDVVLEARWSFAMHVQLFEQLALPVADHVSRLRP